MIWKIVLHPKAIHEVDELPVEMRAKLTRILEIMQTIGPLGLREPHVKSLGKKLMEIRLTGRDGIARAIYALISEKRIAILHAFIKKTQKTPNSALECALGRLKEMNNARLD
jgi:phage-related protein